MQIQSRSAAGLPPVPGSVGHRSLSSWTGIKVHHTGGSFSSWRAIFDWQVHNRPASQRLVDIGYSFGIANGRVTALRGWDHHPAHDHENSTLGVVFGGNYTSRLPPDEDLDAFVEFVRHVREKTGRPLPVSGHRDTWPRGDGRYSTCPGDRLYAHLPTLRRRIDEEDDMPLTNKDVDLILDNRFGSPTLGIEDKPVRWWLKRGARAAAETIQVRGEMSELRGQVAGLTTLVQQLLTADPVQLTPDQLAQLGDRIAAASAGAAAEVLARLEAAGEALADDADDA